MADSRNIVIELKLKDSGGNSLSEKNAEEKSGGEVDLKALLHPVKTIEKATLGKHVVVYQAYNKAKAMLKQEAMYEINKYFSLTENYKAQQDMNNALATIEKVTGFGTAVIAGAMTGGPWGAVAAGVGYVGSEIIQTYQRFDQQNRNLATMNVESTFQLTRMGLIDGGRGSYN